MRFSLIKSWRLWAAIAIMASHASCQSSQQGYWTKENVAQTLTNEQYPSDSQDCDAMSAHDAKARSERYKAILYTKCMQAHGYQWVVERPRPHPLATAGIKPAAISDCPSGRLIVDSFGYHKCVPVGTKDKGIPIEIVPRAPIEAAGLPPPDNHFPSPVQPPQGSPTNDRWRQDHDKCLQYAKESLSSPYGVYTRCMQDRGWSSGS
jgi:hypothetical protein